jgi:hypothetical protein
MKNNDGFLDPVPIVANPAPRPHPRPHEEPLEYQSVPIYCDTDDRLWALKADGAYGRIGEKERDRRLLELGFSPQKSADEALSPLEKAILAISNWHMVHFVGPLAGRLAGPHRVGNQRILVTSSPTIIEAGPGSCPDIDRLLSGLFGPVQLISVLCWLKFAREILDAGEYATGQVLALAGPPNSGKNVFQEQIVTPILGGRSASPFRYMTNRTSFNRELIGAEHHQVSDEAAKDDITERNQITAYIKREASNQQDSQDAKYRHSTLLIPHFRRVTISTNERREDLLLLPLMDEMMLSKVMLLRVNGDNHDCFPSAAEPNQWKMFRVTLQQQLPAFIRQLYDLKIPAALRDPRYGVRAYHDPELLSRICGLAPEMEILAILRQATDKPTAANQWHTATELFELVYAKDILRDGIRALKCQSAKSLGHHLTKLVEQRRIDRKLMEGKNRYLISRDPSDE